MIITFLNKSLIFFLGSEIKKFCFASIIILVNFLPYLILGENSSILIHDNLDCTISWVKVMHDNSIFFSGLDTEIPQIFNGLKRSSLYGTYDISLLVFYFFGPFYGYVINKLLMSLIAFFGMYFFTRAISPNESEWLKHIAFAVALLFSLLPFYGYSASISGLPFVFFAFYNILKHKIDYYNFLIIIIFAFYSSLVLTGVFVLLLFTAVFFYNSIFKKDINWRLILALILLGISYLLSHFPLFCEFFYSNEAVSHRVEFVKETVDFFTTLKLSFHHFLYGQYHARSLHLFILIVLMIFLVFGFVKFFKIKLAVFSLFFLTFASIFYGASKTTIFVNSFEKVFAIVPINPDRLHFLSPVFWYLLLFYTLFLIGDQYRFGKYLCFGIIAVQFLLIIKEHELIDNRNSPSYKDFYAEELFTKINQFIGENKTSYKTISIGIHPSVALYNGFSVLDAYFASYPLSYKQKFYEVIKGELERDSTLHSYFKNWGSRCYAFSSEIGLNFLTHKDEPTKLITLNYHFKKLRSLNCKYIFSVAKIETQNTPELIFLKKFTTPDSYYAIYLYKLIE